MRKSDKNNDSNIKESLRFVASHYNPDAFSKARKKEAFAAITGRRSIFPFLSARWRTAAAVAAVALVASASVLFIHNYSDRPSAPAPSEITPTVAVETQAPVEKAVIDYADAPLKDVVADIERIYGVTVTDVPDKEIRLTIHYEGNAEDVIETINELLGTKLKISRK